MEANKYIEQLLKHKKYFSSGVKDFRLLATLDVDELGQINEQVISITPLLKEIIEYALIPYFIEESEYEEMLIINDNEDIFNEVDDVTTECCEYLNYLLDNNCHHPTVLISKNLINLAYNYDFIVDQLFKLIEKTVITSSKIHNLLVDFDNAIIDSIDETLFELENEIDSIKSPKELLNLFKMYSLIRAKEYGLLLNSNNYYDGNNWCKYCKTDKETIYLSSLFKEIEKIDEYSIPYGEEYNFLDIKKAYYLYKCYQYAYFKNKYKEDKLLEKCKKM